MGVELTGKTLGVIGGQVNIGVVSFSDRARGLKMKVAA